MREMLVFFALIAIAWLTVAALCWAACAMAARGDAESSPRARTGRREPAAGEGLIVWESLPELTVRDARLTTHGVR